MTHYELCKLWYRGGSDSKRAGNMLIAGQTIYSYGLHFPIASKFRGKFLFTLRDYSVTTAKHKYLVHYAISQGLGGDNIVYTFGIDSIRSGHFVKDDLVYFVNAINAHADKSKRAWRHGTWEVEQWFRQIEKLYRTQSIMEEWGIHFDIPEFSPPSLRYCSAKLFSDLEVFGRDLEKFRMYGVPEDFLNECRNLYIKEML